MISSTSSSNPHRRFVAALLAMVLSSMAGLIAFGLYLQPNNGNSNEAWLVRNGGYAERDYGWNKPQQAFIQPLYDRDNYDRYHDIVILGDSFTDLYQPYQWQNYLAAATDKSVMVLSLRRGVSFKQVLNNPVFQQNPPRIFIYEVAERVLNLINNATQCPAAGAANVKVIQSHTISKIAKPINWAHLLAKRVTWIERATGLQVEKLGELISHTKKYLWRNFLRKVFDFEITNTDENQLIRAAPFSSRNTRTLLTFEGERLKQHWNAATLDKMVCEIEQARQQIEANGKTRFVMLIAPDKLTAYEDFLSNQNLQRISFIDAVASRLPNVVPRLDTPLQAAIRAGELDVYLPDDTHWSWRGHQIAAETLLDFLGGV
ncbi:MAG: hypothetical protein ABL903_10890 [Methylococcales bacterium]